MELLAAMALEHIGWRVGAGTAYRIVTDPPTL
jgi:hypothetical protein